MLCPLAFGFNFGLELGGILRMGYLHPLGATVSLGRNRLCPKGRFSFPTYGRIDERGALVLTGGCVGVLPTRVSVARAEIPT